MTSWHYAYSGLHVASDLALPEWDSHRVVAPNDTADVQIRCDARTAEPATLGLLSSTDEQFDFVVPNVAAYQVRSGSIIRVAPARGAAEREVRLFLLGTIWAALLYQRGTLPLHGSVVRVGDGAVAFCGPSGAGKSTVAAWLLRYGYELISDDLSRCEVQPDGPAMVWPSTPRIKLWDDTLAVFGRDSTDLERDHYRHAKFHLMWRGDMQAAPVPLRAVYLLGWGDAGVARLRGGVAVQQLVRGATYHPELLQTSAQITGQWHMCMQLAGATSIWQWSRPRELARLDEVLYRLIDNWPAPCSPTGHLL